MIHKRLPFGVFITEKRSTELAKFWANPSINKLIEMPRHQDHLTWALQNESKFNLRKEDKIELTKHKMDYPTGWKKEYWSESFIFFFNSGWVRIVAHIDLVKSKGDFEVLNELELHSFKEHVNKLGRLLENKFPGSGENVYSIMIEEEFVDMRYENVIDPLRLRRFFKGGKIQ